MTERERQTLDFIRDSISGRGVCPTYPEIATELGINSRSTVHAIVNRLVRDGLLVKVGQNRTRNLKLPGADLGAVPTAALKQEIGRREGEGEQPPMSIRTLRYAASAQSADPRFDGDAWMHEWFRFVGAVYRDQETRELCLLYSPERPSADRDRLLEQLVATPGRVPAVLAKVDQHRKAFDQRLEGVAA